MGLSGRTYVDVCVLQQKSLWDLGSWCCRDALVNPTVMRLRLLLPKASSESGFDPSVASLGVEKEAIRGCCCLCAVLS